MSLLWCRKESVRNPYYVDFLGIHVYSSQELCYVICHNPELALDGMVDENLLGFIRSDLDLGRLAERMREMARDGGNDGEVLALLLTECGYCTSQEISQFKQKAAALRKLHPADYGKQVADRLFKRKQYGKAADRYEKLLEYPKDKVVDNQFLAKVWHNLGSSLAQMFCFEKAFQALSRAYGMNDDKNTLKQLYFLTMFAPQLSLSGRYQGVLTPELKKKWDQELEQGRQNSLAAPDVVRLRELFQKKEEDIQLEEAGEMVNRWKKEYRMMI